MTKSHCFRTKDIEAQNKYPEGNRLDINEKIFPSLQDMALSILTLAENGFREPHWHPNAHELAYCLEGSALMTIFSPGATHETFTLSKGELAFVPMGSLHHIQNIGKGSVRFLLCYNSSSPEDLNLSSAIGVSPGHVLGATFHKPASFFEKLHASINPVFIQKSLEAISAQGEWKVNRFKIDVEGMHPQIENKGGSVRLINQFFLPTLQGLTLYSLDLEEKGVREPHWHPNAHELNFLIEGRAKITLLSPNGNVDSFEMSEGDMSFLPKGYFHYIESIAGSKARFAIFFNHVFPSDIGISGSLGAYTNTLLADVFNVSESYFDGLPKYQEDLFVVAGGG
jgi:oxalate decarboxylase